MMIVDCPGYDPVVHRRRVRPLAVFNDNRITDPRTRAMDALLLVVNALLAQLLRIRFPLTSTRTPPLETVEKT